MHKEYTDQIGGLYSRHCAVIENKSPEPPQFGLYLLLKGGGGGLFSGGYGISNIVQLEYWWELNLVVDSNRHGKLKYYLI